MVQLQFCVEILETLHSMHDKIFNIETEKSRQITCLFTLMCSGSDKILRIFFTSFLVYFIYISIHFAQNYVSLNHIKVNKHFIFIGLIIRLCIISIPPSFYLLYSFINLLLLLLFTMTIVVLLLFWHILSLLFKK